MDFYSIQLVEESQLERALQMVKTGKRMTNYLHICVGFRATADTIDRIIAYFQKACGLKQAVTSSFGPLDITGWPTLCPEEMGVQLYPDAPYEYIFINEKSKRRFSVKLRACNEVKSIKSLILDFM